MSVICLYIFRSRYNKFIVRMASTSHGDTKVKKNKLAFEKSPYLLQHAGNPVNWYPWNDEALEKAKREDKLIFLSVGYSTCHWCHVMEKESFENDEIAQVMNRYFVNIKVDREERPDIDKIYMTFVQVLVFTFTYCFLIKNNQLIDLFCAVDFRTWRLANECIFNTNFGSYYGWYLFSSG